MLNCVAIDDEPLALEKLKGFIERIPYLNLIAEFSDCISALPYLEKEAVDILFLDIQMDYMTGIQMLETSHIKPHIIIISAYSEHALKGYELNVSDYILKPYGFDRFMKAVNKVRSAIENATREFPDEDKDYVFVKTDSRIIKILLDNILYLEGMRDYICIHTTEKKILTLLKFPEILELLPSSQFQRIHKSYIVSLRHIDSIERHRVKISDKLLPVSLTYRDEFYKRLKA